MVKMMLNWVNHTCVEPVFIFTHHEKFFLCVCNMCQNQTQISLELLGIFGCAVFTLCLCAAADFSFPWRVTCQAEAGLNQLHLIPDGAMVACWHSGD